MWLWVVSGVIAIAVVWIVARWAVKGRGAARKPANVSQRPVPERPSAPVGKAPTWQPTAPFLDSHPPASAALDHAFAETTFDDQIEPLERPTGFADTRVLGEEEESSKSTSLLFKSRKGRA